MRLIVVGETGYHGADESEKGGDGAGGETHFGLTETLVTGCEPGGDLIGERTGEVCAGERADEWGNKDKTLGT